MWINESDIPDNKYHNKYKIKDMLLAHKVLMNELTKEAGIFRSGGVGVFAGKQFGVLL